MTIFLFVPDFTCFEVGLLLGETRMSDYWSLLLYWGVTLLALTLTLSSLSSTTPLTRKLPFPFQIIKYE
jgi:hypothetical protein